MRVTVPLPKVATRSSPPLTMTNPLGAVAAEDRGSRRVRVQGTSSSDCGLERGRQGGASEFEVVELERARSLAVQEEVSLLPHDGS
jgi:hypothetical protein